MDIQYKKNDYTMRLAKKDDFENYYSDNFSPVSDSIAYFTGCKKYFTRDEVYKYLIQSIDDMTRRDFIVLNKDNKIIGEVILNDIESDTKQANFRIGIFNEKELGKGHGSWMISNILEYGFNELNLNRIYLDVFSFNDRAIHLYKKMGFLKEGMLRQAILDGDRFTDVILMSILQNKWKELNY